MIMLSNYIYIYIYIYTHTKLSCYYQDGCASEVRMRWRIERWSGRKRKEREKQSMEDRQPNRGGLEKVNIYRKRIYEMDLIN